MTQRKVFTEEFKRDAVRLAKERGNIAQTARELGIRHDEVPSPHPDVRRFARQVCADFWYLHISDNTLQGWKLQLDKTPENPFPGNGNPRDPEMARLQKENARLKEENDILKKAMGIFTPRPR
jgi:transposase